MNRLISILTDFGIADNYNGVMEGVIRKFNKNVDITYISPNAKNFSIYSGAYLLYTSYRFFRKNTIFLVVIDPGVGTKRKAIIVKTKNYIFIGPDNGVLYPAIKEDQIEKIIEINNEKLYLSKNISKTFHGRDIFAVTAAFISLDLNLEVFGNIVSENDIQKLEYKTFKKDNLTCGEIIYIDHFGNIATSIRDFDTSAKIYINSNVFYARKVNTFGESQDKELLIYRNGYGFMEIGINKENAAMKLGVKEGDIICLEGYIQGDFSHFT
ncbi:hypothetical protein DFR86_06390 [Acidianus sulfidivorans JP7]|uniref:SAM-dependent chlorinase/fluorinase n=1 Tax=Acidianus sulfidivorans JP7 TaxID=619593 RepID=A0A2U9IMK8_9CREN|nr:SAM-dependent chlorinase/fluorinase [Acidianus sulfidivorans]AWR97225.1 hypothetical protein DFR86_06390 [Acidianus sulfidivorans JP7]